MQGLPFDENDFPPQVSVSSTWMDQSPRLAASSNPNTTAVTDEELYRMVGAPPHQSTPQSHTLPPQVSGPDILQRFSQQAPLLSVNASPLYQQHHATTQLQLHPPSMHHPIPQSHQKSHRRSRRQLPPQAGRTQGHMQQSSKPRQRTQRSQQSSDIPSSPSSIPFHLTNQHSAAVNNIPARKHRPEASNRPVSQRDPKALPVTPPASTVSVVQHEVVSPQENVQAYHSELVGTSGGTGPNISGFARADGQKKPVRSAVEEARLRAQREAETYASSRRDPTKREISIAAGTSGKITDTIWEGVGERRSTKRTHSDIDPLEVAEKQPSRKLNSRSSAERGDEKSNDSEVEKQERYKRRLDMNRESAAVSRVRRRAYVKELEERLAACEAEKLQLEGKLDIMLSQNEGFKKQLEHLFMMVASGRCPTYPAATPPPPSEDGPP